MSRPRFVADENLNERLVLTLLRRAPDADADVVRVRDAGRRGQSDEEILAWAAAAGRILITHDARTVPPTAFARVAAGQVMCGVLIVPDDAPPRATIDDLELIARASKAEEWLDRVVFVPFGA